MTDDALRIAIAEACPKLFEVHQTWRCGTLVTYLTRRGSGVAGDELDPLNDLNAMHEAEKTLNADQFTEYHGTLVVMRNKDCMPMCRCISAPAHQRAKAFVSALNLQAERTPSLTKPGAAWSRED